MEKEILEKIVKQSQTFKEVLTALNKKDTGSQYRIVKKKIIEFNIDTSHFLNHSEFIKKLFSEGRLIKKDDNEIFCENSKVARSLVKRRFLLIDGVKNECVECGQNEKWRDKKITLILDHENGKSNDNRLENLRLLCPNCNSALETHCLGFERLKRKEFIKNKEKIKKEYVYIPRLERRKVIRPSLEQLLEDINNTNYLAVGKKYGVSDVLIRKWIKNYGAIPPKKFIRKISASNRA